jgi:ribosomal protein L29
MNKKSKEDLRKKSIPELKKLLNDLEYQQIKASSVWGRDLIDKRKAGITKGATTQGTKTSIQKDLRRMRSRLKTIINEKSKQR